MKPSHPFLSLFMTLSLLAAAPAQAHNKVVVIPMSGDDLKPLKNVITVAKANGDFTDPVAAVASISDATVNNPYLVVIAPGVYTVTSAIIMKAYVDIAGSGQDVTRITGAVSSVAANATSAIVSGADNAELSDLTVVNSGGSNESYSIYNISASPRLMHVTATASGGTADNIGVYNSFSSPTLTTVTATASGGSTSYGVYNFLSSPTLTNVTVIASGGSTSHAVHNNTSSDAPRIEHSSLEGSTAGMYFGFSPGTRITNTRIVGGISQDYAATTQCRDNYDAALADVTC